MQKHDRQFRVFGLNNTGDFDFRGADHHNIDPLLGQGCEHPGATPEWLIIPTPMMDTLATCSSTFNFGSAYFLRRLLNQTLCFLDIFLDTVKLRSYKPSRLAF
jgi:hypothetical protein